MRNHLVKAILTVLLLSVPTPALAFRCGTWLIREGDTAAAVIRRCGAPTTRSEGWVQQQRGDSVVKVRTETWTYDFGRQRFIQILRFVEDRLVEIVAGGYGT